METWKPNPLQSPHQRIPQTNRIVLILFRLSLQAPMWPRFFTSVQFGTMR